MIYNEHLKSAVCLISDWTQLFNDCLREGALLEQWRSRVMIAIPKSKGGPTEPSSWCGICKKSCAYKLLSSLIVRRLTPFLEFRDCLPNEQHGFRPYRSTTPACRVLLDGVLAAKKKNGPPLFAVFVDFRAAFDTGSRTLVLLRLAQAGVSPRLLSPIIAILGENSIRIDDGIALGEGIPQTSGYAQGDNLSPLLFFDSDRGPAKICHKEEQLRQLPVVRRRLGTLHSTERATSTSNRRCTNSAAT